MAVPARLPAGSGAGLSTGLCQVLCVLSGNRTLRNWAAERRGAGACKGSRVVPAQHTASPTGPVGSPPLLCAPQQHHEARHVSPDVTDLPPVDSSGLVGWSAPRAAPGVPPGGTEGEGSLPCALPAPRSGSEGAGLCFEYPQLVTPCPPTGLRLSSAAGVTAATLHKTSLSAGTTPTVTPVLTARGHQGTLSRRNTRGAYRECLRNGSRRQLQCLQSSLPRAVFGWIVTVKESGVCLTQASSCGI